MLRAGTLVDRITIQSSAVGQNEYGEPLEGWQNVFVNIAASVKDVSGREFLAAAAAQNEVQTKITIRRLAGIKPAMRVVHGADLYNIAAVLMQGKDACLLMCSRGLNDG